MRKKANNKTILFRKFIVLELIFRFLQEYRRFFEKKGAAEYGNREKNIRCLLRREDVLV